MPSGRHIEDRLRTEWRQSHQPWGYAEQTGRETVEHIERYTNWRDGRAPPRLLGQKCLKRSTLKLTESCLIFPRHEGLAVQEQWTNRFRDWWGLVSLGTGGTLSFCLLMVKERQLSKASVPAFCSQRHSLSKPHCSAFPWKAGFNTEIIGDPGIQTIT